MGEEEEGSWLDRHQLISTLNQLHLVSVQVKTQIFYQYLVKGIVSRDGVSTEAFGV
jgi:hypothetical protein